MDTNTQEILQLLAQAVNKKKVRRKYVHPSVLEKQAINNEVSMAYMDDGGEIRNEEGLILIEMTEEEAVDMVALKLLLQEVKQQESIERIKSRNLSSSDPEKLERIIEMRKNAAKDYSLDELERTSLDLNPEDIFLNASVDEAFFIEGLTLQDPQAPNGVLPFKLWPAQRELLGNLYGDYSVIQILKARQIGISQFILSHLLYVALFENNKNILILSKKGEDAKDLIRRVRFLFDSISYSDRLGVASEYFPDVTNNNMQNIMFSNGSAIQALAATEDAGRSRTASIVLLDEADFLEKPIHTYNALKPVINAKGQIILVSTGNGVNNLMAQVWKQAKSGSKGIFATFLNWRSRPDRDDDWYKEKYDQATDIDMFKQEYPETAEEAFITSSTARFQLSWLQQQAVSSAQYSLIDNPFPHISTGLSIWHTPVAGKRYYIGVDTAEGDAGGDYSVASVWSQDRIQVAEYRLKTPYDILANVVVELAQYYNNALCIIERNSYGASTLKEVQKLGALCYADVSGKPGFWTSQQSKIEIIDTLARLLRDNRLVVSSVDLYNELTAFERTERGKLQASIGSHDDTVIAAAVALHIIETTNDTWLLPENVFEIE